MTKFDSIFICTTTSNTNLTV